MDKRRGKQKRQKEIDMLSGDDSYFEPMDRTSVVLNYGIQSIRDSLAMRAKNTKTKDPQALQMLEQAEERLAELYGYLGQRWAE